MSISVGFGCVGFGFGFGFGFGLGFGIFGGSLSVRFFGRFFGRIGTGFVVGSGSFGFGFLRARLFIEVGFFWGGGND